MNTWNSTLVAPSGAEQGLSIFLGGPLNCIGYLTTTISVIIVDTNNSPEECSASHVFTQPSTSAKRTFSSDCVSLFLEHKPVLSDVKNLLIN